LTLAEITACGKPSILVPLPFATADHQRHNAEGLQKEGAAKMILEKNLTAEGLAAEIGSLLADESALKQMEEASAKMGKPEAASMLVDEMEKLLRSGNRNSGHQFVKGTRQEA
jgi:UDP-N-acetylglucosamine--N-acetylmuramyl-(pentapeptide) pyrophosphoryl-undecaprenol N-acetylglucosamine transferase